MKATHCHFSKLVAVVITKTNYKQDFCEENSVPYLLVLVMGRQT